MDRLTSLIEFFASIRGMSNEQRLVSDKANEEARKLHQENPDGALGLPRAIPVTEPNEDPNGDGLPLSPKSINISLGENFKKNNRKYL